MIWGAGRFKSQSVGSSPNLSCGWVQVPWNKRYIYKPKTAWSLKLQKEDLLYKLCDISIMKKVSSKKDVWNVSNKMVGKEYLGTERYRRNVYIIICEADHWSMFDAWDRVLRAGALGWPWGMGWVGRWDEGSGWGTHVHLWLTHVNVWKKPLQYCKVISLQLK